MKLFVGSLDLYGNPDLSAGNMIYGDSKMELLQMMISPPFFSMNTEHDPGRFIDNCLDCIREYSALDLEAPGETIEERVEAFFEVLVENKLAVFLDDKSCAN